MSTIKSAILRVLIFIRLVDEHDSNLSLTNIGLIIVLIKLAIVQQASLTDLAALFLALLNYQGKKALFNQQTALNSLKKIPGIIDAVTKTSEVVAEKERELNVNS